MKYLVIAAMAACMVPGLALAQDCTIAVYGDPGGAWSELCPGSGVSFSVYVLLFAENTVSAAAYSLLASPPGQTLDLFQLNRWSGPSGSGLVIDEETGTNVALGECVIGFGGHPVLVDEYRYVAYTGTAVTLDIEPNTSQDPDHPVYVTCNGITKPCEAGPTFVIPWDCTGVDSEARSFGVIKSLYH